MSRRLHRRCASLVALVSVASLAGCPAPTATVTPGPMPGIQHVGTGSQAFLIDIDPHRASAFERTSEGDLSLLVGSPEVSHDLASGKTTVRLSVTNAGAPLSDLQVFVSGDRRAVSQRLGESVVQKSGGTRPVELVFDNPGGDSFSVRLDFSGRQLALSAQPLARHLLSLGVVGATASSSYGSLVPERAVDGNLSSQWANGGYQEPEAHLTLDLGEVKQVTTLGLKMRPQSGGAYYRIEVSSNGSSFTPVTGQLKNNSWNTETKTLPSGTEARYVRVHFFNDASSPETRFSVFEAVVDGGAGTGTAPTPAPSTAPTPTPTPTSTPAPSVGGMSASSTYSGLSPANAVDGNWSSQWSNGGYRESEAWLQWDLGSVRVLGSFTSKMRPQTGSAHYRLEVSSDGSSFSPVTGQLRNTTWGSEVQQLPSGTSGRYVRLRFFNDAGAPMDRFSVFEMQVSGSGGGATPAPTPTPAPTATPTPMPTPTPSTAPTGSLLDTFESYSLGTDPSAFVDPLDEGYNYSWMPRVNWRVASHDGSKQYMHDGLSNQANLSFRRYRGTAFGTTNGRLPDRYFSEVDVTSIKSYTYSPTGDQGTQFYYLNPTNYVELLIKPNLFEVWVANEAQPFQSRGWQRLYYTPISTNAGQKRRLGADIDATRGTIKVYFDGRLMTTLSHSMLNTQAHYFALRGTGNIVVHDNLRIEPR